MGEIHKKKVVQLKVQRKGCTQKRNYFYDGALLF